MSGAGASRSSSACIWLETIDIGTSRKQPFVGFPAFFTLGSKQTCGNAAWTARRMAITRRRRPLADFHGGFDRCGAACPKRTLMTKCSNTGRQRRLCGRSFQLRVPAEGLLPMLAVQTSPAPIRTGMVCSLVSKENACSTRMDLNFAASRTSRILLSDSPNSSPSEACQSH